MNTRVLVRSMVTASGQLLCSAAVAIAVASAIVVGAKLRIHLPGTPVPITLQTFALFVAAALAPSNLGIAGAALYVVAATVGLPVIAGPSIFGPTGGYILGFVAAAAVLTGASRCGPLQIFLRMVVAEVIIHLLGVVWLATWAGSSLEWAVGAGMLPFIIGDAAKLCAAWAAVCAWQARKLNR